MAGIFVRFRYRKRWWPADVVIALAFVVAAVVFGTPAVGFVESLTTGLLFAVYVETCIVVAFVLRGWVRRRFEGS